MSENYAALMAVLRSEFKKLRDEAAAASPPVSVPAALEDRLSAIESAQHEMLSELRHSTRLMARAIGIIHSELPSREPLPDELLRDEIFREFMENYPASAAPAYNVERHSQLAGDMAGWSDEQFAAKKRDKEAQISEGKFDPLDAYKGRVILDLYAAEQERRAERDRSRAVDKDR